MISSVYLYIFSLCFFILLSFYSSNVFIHNVQDVLMLSYYYKKKTIHKAQRCDNKSSYYIVIKKPTRGHQIFQNHWPEVKADVFPEKVEVEAPGSRQKVFDLRLKVVC